MEIYLKIDKMVKMYKFKVYIPHEKLCLCCFLTVSCLINAILASCNVLVFQLLRRSKSHNRTVSYYGSWKKTRENWTVLRCPEKKGYKNYLHSTLIAPKLRLSTERRFCFLENVSLVPNIEPWPQEEEKCR